MNCVVTMSDKKVEIMLSDVLRPFDGSNADIVQWLEKIKMVAKLRGVDDLATIVPLFLEGPAYAVFSELSEESKNKYDDIKSVLESAFSISPFKSYEMLIAKKWKGEPVDVYMSEVRRLAKIVGIEGGTLLLRAFVAGMPADISK